jgi:UDPglucose--hexose-1-phosphate uridylyltransferase
VRVVPNLYPALDEHADFPAAGERAEAREAGWGVHEVVVETPVHEERLRTLGADRLTEVLGVWRDRVLVLGAKERVRQVMVYRNEGPEAGATLSHPHAQILALPRIPREVGDELRGAHAWWETEQQCFYCDLLAREVAARTRVVHADETVVVLAPFASRVPYETWILPRHHEADFAGTSSGTLEGVARAVARWAERLELARGEFASNLVLHTAPSGLGACSYYHWHLELLPRVTRLAAFEWGSGWTINPVFPEQAAAVLRGDDDA